MMFHYFVVMFVMISFRVAKSNFPSMQLSPRASLEPLLLTHMFLSGTVSYVLAQTLCRMSFLNPYCSIEG